MQRIAPVLGALLLAGACATATPYQAADTDARYGYAGQQIESDRFRVSFSGNSLTDRATVETFLLYRAAELALQEGYDWFEIMDRSTDEDTRLVSTGTGFGSPFHAGFGYNFYGPYGRFLGSRFHDPFFNDFDVREVSRYEAYAEIKLGRGEEPEGGAFYDAREVAENLRGSITLPER